MFHDLNIVWPGTWGPPPDPPKKGVKRKDPRAGGEKASKADAQDKAISLTPAQEEQVQALLTDAAELGYYTVAFNFIVESRFDAVAHRCRYAPLATGQAAPPFPQLDPRCQATTKAKYSSAAAVLQLTRLTLLLDESSLGKAGHGMTANNQSELLKYDVLSAQPFNDASLSIICLTMTELKPISIDIISIDAASAARTPFFLKRSLVNTAIANGAVFEICYARAVSIQTAGNAKGEENSATRDALLKARRNIISVTRDLLRVTNGKGLILSSGAADIMGLRGPYDVINLATIFGMNATAARDAISSTCRSLLLRAEARKSFRGVAGDPVVVTLGGHTLPTLHQSAADVQGSEEEPNRPALREKPSSSLAKRKQGDDGSTATKSNRQTSDTPVDKKRKTK